MSRVEAKPSTVFNDNRVLLRRRITNVVMCTFLGMCLMVAVVPLLAVLWFTIREGATRLDLNFLTHSMRGVGPLDANGGAYHAIIGTLEQVAIAGVLSIPLGIAVAVYIVEVGSGKLAYGVRFLVDVMTGIPSIVAGLFIFSFWVLALGQGFSGFAAALALAILMLPTVIRSTEEMLKLVPSDLREASYALGISQRTTILSVVLPTASSGIITGLLLAVARVIGETAPLLLTAFGFDAIRNDPFSGPQSGLPLFVFTQASSAFSVAIDRAWAGALTLILIVLLLTVVARVLSRRSGLAGA